MKNIQKVLYSNCQQTEKNEKHASTVDKVLNTNASVFWFPSGAACRLKYAKPQPIFIFIFISDAIL